MRNTHIPVDVDAVGGALGRLTRALLIARSFQTPAQNRGYLFRKSYVLTKAGHEFRHSASNRMCHVRFGRYILGQIGDGETPVRNHDAMGRWRGVPCRASRAMQVERLCAWSAAIAALFQVLSFLLPLWT